MARPQCDTPLVVVVVVEVQSDKGFEGRETPELTEI
jgi:hypothetical protein